MTDFVTLLGEWGANHNPNMKPHFPWSETTNKPHRSSNAPKGWGGKSRRSWECEKEEMNR